MPPTSTTRSKSDTTTTTTSTSSSSSKPSGNSITTTKTTSVAIPSVPYQSNRGMSLSLPLLEGLCRRPSTAQSIVTAALHKFDAAQLIAKWVQGKYHHRRRRQQQQQQEQKNKDFQEAQTPQSKSMNPFLQTMPPHQHWLWEALKSASRPERHSAARLLLMGGCYCGSCRGSHDNSNNDESSGTATSTHGAQDEDYEQWKLQQVLIALWNAHAVPPLPLMGSITTNNGTSNNRAAALPSSYIPVEWMALLKHVVFGRSVTEEQIMAFCLKGIPWISQSIWQLVMGLSSTNNNTGVAGGGEKLYDQNEEYKLSQLQALIGLVELLYPLLMVVVEPIPPEKTTEATTGTEASPAKKSGNSSRSIAGVSQTTPMTAASPDQTSNTAKEKKEPDELIAERLKLRRRLVKRLFWKSFPSTTKAVDATTAAAAPTTTHPNYHHHHYDQYPHNLQPLSPLACLVGAFHVWKTNTDWPFPGPMVDASLAMLRQLVDINATTKVVNLVAEKATGISSPLGSGFKREAPESSNSRSNKRRKRTRAAASQLTQQQQQQASGSSPFLFRSSSSERSAAGNNNAAANNNERRRGDAPRLLSQIFAGHHSEDDGEDDIEEVVMEMLDEDDDDSETEAVAAVRRAASGAEMSGNVLHEDEAIDSEEEHDEEDEDLREEGEQAMDKADHNEHDEDHDHDDDDDEDDDEDDDDDDEFIHEEHDEIVARLEEGFLSLNDAGDEMDIDLEQMMGGGRGGDVESRAAELVRAARSQSQDGMDAANVASANTATSSSNSAVDDIELAERKRLYLQACMQVLAVQHPPYLPFTIASNYQSGRGGNFVARTTSPSPFLSASPYFRAMSPTGLPPSPGSLAANPTCFRIAAETSLLEAAMAIVRPLKEPVNIKMIMRRAPTQEEFFRGSLSRNPISLSMLKPSGEANSVPSGDSYEPTVRDLRQHIANDLQMSDSAEMLELIVANKIIGIDLKLRVVHQVLWRNHLMEHSHGSSGSSGSALASLLANSGGGASSFFSTGSGLSMMFSSGIGGVNLGGSGAASQGRGAANSAITEETPLAALPPLVITYRLAGVDGEATEDTVNTLVDPEAPSDEMSPEQVEQLLEKEYGITRIVSEGRGIFVLLRSIEHHVQEALRKIRRDDVDVLMEYPSNSSSAIGKNISRNKFKSQAPYPGLTLLQCCAKLPSNRQKLLQARAPTILLRLLLDVLGALEDPYAKNSKDSLPENSDSVGSKTAGILQELIEALASDISITAVSTRVDPETADKCAMDDIGSASDSATAAAEGQEQDATTLSLVLSSLETIKLSPPLRNIIAKLLPFLTYGQEDLSRELALNFDRNIHIRSLVDDDNSISNDTKFANAMEQSLQEKDTSVCTPGREVSGKSSVLMEAFVQASITLPANDVCNSLRSELIKCGFIDRLAAFIMEGIPASPPSWAAALLPKKDATEPPTTNPFAAPNAWRTFYQRQGIKTAFNMLIGLCKHHFRTQMYISKIGEDNKLPGTMISFLQACHWLESTSDSASDRVYVRGIGGLAEELMDELMDGNEVVAIKVNALRRATRLRKKEIAEARRNKALSKMSSFGGLVVANNASAATEDASQGNSVRMNATSLFAPMLGFFGNGAAGEGASPATAAARTNRRNNSRSRQKTLSEINKDKEKLMTTNIPAWMMEMEQLEDEEGLVCSVCQEGRTLQPSELLGLYAYVKKVSISADQCGNKDSIDGSTMLKILPSTLPKSLSGTHCAEHWHPAGLAAGNELRESQRSSYPLGSSINRRNNYYTTTVSAGNAIHFSCHQRAREADRNHPKAPKSEWEGACLRNNRVQTNVILPLVSTKSSDVSLVAVDSALSEYQTAVNNLTGNAPKSMLWTVLHDIRFLLMRMAYGELLNADCGGGSLSSNAQLLVNQLMMADMFERDAQVDSPETSKHVRDLSAGFLAACSILHAKDYKKGTTPALTRALGDSAPMAAVTCILTRNSRGDFGAAEESTDSKPHPKRRWIIGREQFLRGLVICAGRRHALGIESSGCLSGRGGASGGRPRSGASSFPNWDTECPESAGTNATSTSNSISTGGRKGKKRSPKADISDFGKSLRPMITLFGLLDHLSEGFVLTMKDAEVEATAENIVKFLGYCQRAKGIRELLEICKANCLDEDEILADFQRGMASA